NETSMTAPNDNAIRRALEAAGVEFIDEDGAGPRVRLRKRQGKKAYSRAFFHQRYAVTRRNQPGASRAIEDITIAEVARTNAVGFSGPNCLRQLKTQGTPRKFVDVPQLSTMGWKAKVSLREGPRKPMLIS